MLASIAFMLIIIFVLLTDDRKRGENMNGVIIPSLTGEKFAKIKHIAMPASGSATYEADTDGRGQWSFLASCEIWATSYTELVYVKGYVTASRSIVTPIVNAGTPITITGSDSSKVYTITNNTTYAFDLAIVELD